MNLHRDQARLKLITIMFIASVLLLIACLVVGVEEGWISDEPSAPVTGNLEMPPVYSEPDSQIVTFPPEMTTTGSTTTETTETDEKKEEE